MRVNSKRNAQKGVLKIYKNTSFIQLGSRNGFGEKLGLVSLFWLILVGGSRVMKNDLRLCLAIFPRSLFSGQLSATVGGI